MNKTCIHAIKIKHKQFYTNAHLDIYDIKNTEQVLDKIKMNMFKQFILQYLEPE